MPRQNAPIPTLERGRSTAVLRIVLPLVWLVAWALLACSYVEDPPLPQAAPKLVDQDFSYRSPRYTYNVVFVGDKSRYPDVTTYAEQLQQDARQIVLRGFRHNSMLARYPDRFNFYTDASQRLEISTPPWDDTRSRCLRWQDRRAVRALHRHIVEGRFSTMSARTMVVLLHARNGSVAGNRDCHLAGTNVVTTNMPDPVTGVGDTNYAVPVHEFAHAAFNMSDEYRGGYLKAGHAILYRSETACKPVENQTCREIPARWGSVWRAEGSVSDLMSKVWDPAGADNVLEFGPRDVLWIESHFASLRSRSLASAGSRRADKPECGKRPEMTATDTEGFVPSAEVYPSGCPEATNE